MELSSEISRDLGVNTQQMERDLKPLDPFTISTKDEWWGFRITVKDPGNNNFVGFFRFTRILDFDNSPDTLKEVLAKRDEKVFFGSLGIEPKYQKKGIGKALWELGILKLFAKEGEFLHEVQDASREKVDEIPWTSRTLPKLLDSLRDLGINSDILWTGTIDNKDSFLIRYKKAKPSPNPENFGAL